MTSTYSERCSDTSQNGHLIASSTEGGCSMQGNPKPADVMYELQRLMRMHPDTAIAMSCLDDGTNTGLYFIAWHEGGDNERVVEAQGRTLKSALQRTIIKLKDQQWKK